MLEEARRQLNLINREFYRITADAFDQTRSQPWEGWYKLLDYLPPVNDGFHVLDVGCGNGRFGAFLAEQFPQSSIVYHGIDSSAELLNHAQTALEIYQPRLRLTFEQRDFIEDGLPEIIDRYDLVVLFGVLHHIPGFEQRSAFIESLTQHVESEGVLAFTIWRFYEFERFRSRIIPWPPELAEKVEPHDYLLDWRRGDRAVRYCHYVDEVELKNLIFPYRNNFVKQYIADGREAFNRYIICGGF
jgi:tRNA (uracil-5-)-methyltransferase TRM9